ncbi:MAG: HigA family addiction module antidote protein [Firmicutes bacterium]|nr:HigA family addiction module antidote protein [Bacillota bacterium]
MNKNFIPNIHPGEILREEFLKPMDITPYRLAKSTLVPATRISEIVNERRGITADTALRLGKFFGMSAEFWLGLQMEYELREAKMRKIHELKNIKTYQQITS